MKGVETFVLILLLGTLSVSLYFLWQNLPGQTEEFKSIGVDGKMQNVYTNGTQFYPNLRYADKIISYSVAQGCSGNKEKFIADTFSLLSEKTVLYFHEVSDNGEIEILCSEIAPSSENKNHFIAGEGGPNDIIDTGLFYVISSGKVSLFREEKCKEPKIVLHEFLHALGFDHNNNPKSILYPITSCDEQLDQYIIDEINKLYITESLPDLAIVRASASKSGRYLSFDVNITNQGLKDASYVILSLYANNEKIKEFELGNISIGIRKSINVENSKIPLNTDTIQIVVDIVDDAKEISLDNNKVELSIVQT